MDIKKYLEFDISFLQVEFALSKKCPLNWRLKIESREFYGLVYIITGRADFVFPDRTVNVHADDIVFLRKGDCYELKSVSDISLEFIVISFDFESEHKLPFETVIKVGHTMRFLEMFKLTEEIYVTKGIAHKLYCRSMVEQIMYHLIIEQSYSVKSIEKIQASINYIEDYYEKGIDIKTLADIANLSQSYYRKRFKEIYGITPLQYINKIRIEKAKDMLKSGVYTQSEIASRCGFDNVQYFNRVFKKLTNKTPGRY